MSCAGQSYTASSDFFGQYGRNDVDDPELHRPPAANRPTLTSSNAKRVVVTTLRSAAYRTGLEVSRDGRAKGFDRLRIDILVKPNDLAIFDGSKHDHVEHKAPAARCRCFDPMPPDAPISDYELLIEHIADSNTISPKPRQQSDVRVF
jgi:hypothetical protein